MKLAINEKDHAKKTWRIYDHDRSYVFSIPCHPDNPGHQQLEIAVHAMLTFHYHHPASAHFPGIFEFWGYEVLKIRHPWQRGKKYQVIPGVVILKDRVEKTLEAFTFGGDLRIETQNDCTKCSLKSSAPILPLDIRPSVSALLADEVEFFPAERREAWDEGHPRTDFEEHLAEIDPFTPYMSCLEVLRDKFSRFPHADPENILEFRQSLRTERVALPEQRYWPIYLPLIEKLL
jgi:hypothetical protein